MILITTPLLGQITGNTAYYLSNFTLSGNVYNKDKTIMYHGNVTYRSEVYLILFKKDSIWIYDRSDPNTLTDYHVLEYDKIQEKEVFMCANMTMSAILSRKVIDFISIGQMYIYIFWQNGISVKFLIGAKRENFKDI